MTPTEIPQSVAEFRSSLANRYRLGTVFQVISAIATFFGVIVLFVLLIDVFGDGIDQFSWPYFTTATTEKANIPCLSWSGVIEFTTETPTACLRWPFIMDFPSRIPERAGIFSPLIGSIWLLATTAVFSFTIGVGAGIFLEEFAQDNWFTRFIEINISNLAAVPSIVYGLLAVGIFVQPPLVRQYITGGQTVLAGALTMTLLILPIIIVATREALRAVPDSLRQAGMALGATRWEVVWAQILPLSMPGILTGTILALSRAIGETAPLITIGALTFITYLPPVWPLWIWDTEANFPGGLQTDFTVLPIQIFNWVSRPQKDFHGLSAGGILVLMVVLLAMNATAVILRNRLQRKY